MCLGVEVNLVFDFCDTGDFLMLSLGIFLEGVCFGSLWFISLGEIKTLNILKPFFTFQDG